MRTIILRLQKGSASESDFATFRASAATANDDLLLRAEREARAGARIIFWGEANSVVLKEDEAALVERVRALAFKYRIYMAIGMLSWNRLVRPSAENKAVLIGPNGQTEFEYLKARPTPGPEAANSIRGDGRLRSVDTPYGRLSVAICLDADFPQLLAQAGAMGTDILLNPSNDWPAIDPWHTQMASFRGIEQGFNQVRQTSNGLSAAYDYQGRQLAAMDHFRAPDRAMTAQVPIKGVRTLYSRLRDWFAWLSLLGLGGLVVAGAGRQGIKTSGHDRKVAS
jgi:apolipoprotein N-acyltransferase